MTDETAMSPDGGEVAAGLNPSDAFETPAVVTVGTITPTQVAHPWRATVRTAIATALGIGTAALVAWPDVQAVLDQTVTPLLPEQVVAWLAKAGGVTFAVTSAVTRILALTSVNDVLTRVGLGPAPKPPQSDAS